MTKKRTRQIAPRLESGDSRIHVFLNLPDEVKEGLMAIARAENPPQSVSWVLEQAMYDYFGLDRPAFKRSVRKLKADNVAQFRRAATHRRR